MILNENIISSQIITEDIKILIQFTTNFYFKFHIHMLVNSSATYNEVKSKLFPEF